MNGQRTKGTLGVYDAVDSAAETIERLRAAGIKRITVFSPVPSHDLEHALHAGESPVRMFTLVGGLTGAATGFALPTWMSLDWPLDHRRQADHLDAGVGDHRVRADDPVRRAVDGRRPVHQRAAAAAAVMQVYDPSFSSDRFGVLVMPPAGQARPGARDHARQRRGRDPRAGAGGEGWRPLGAGAVRLRAGARSRRALLAASRWRPSRSAPGCTRIDNALASVPIFAFMRARRHSIRTSTRCRRRRDRCRSSRRTGRCCRRSRRRSRR
jgi:hypothetical protein